MNMMVHWPYKHSASVSLLWFPSSGPESILTCSSVRLRQQMQRDALRCSLVDYQADLTFLPRLPAWLFLSPCCSLSFREAFGSSVCVCVCVCGMESCSLTTEREREGGGVMGVTRKRIGGGEPRREGWTVRAEESVKLQQPGDKSFLSCRRKPSSGGSDDPGACCHCSSRLPRLQASDRERTAGRDAVVDAYAERARTADRGAAQAGGSVAHSSSGLLLHRISRISPA